MVAKQKPYEQYGPFILFKKLESDALGDLWRAGRIEPNGVSTTVALRRLTGGNREALPAAAKIARQVAPLLTGPSFARSQLVDVVNGVVCVSHEYSGGRSLRYIIDRGRGGQGATANPLPIDQAIVIVEKVALSLATISDLRFSGEKLSHGGLLPHFVWISDDGEIRVAGQQLGKGLVASLKDPKVGAEIGRYFSPEYRHSGEVTKASEVYSVGALLFLAVTGQEPPDASTTSAFASSIRAAKTMAGGPIPDEIRAIFEKSLNLDPAVRFAGMTEMKNALSVVSAKYGATSFNLAFYLSSLLKKEFESEAAEREHEEALNVQPYVEALLAPPAAAAPVVTPAPAAVAPSPAPFAATLAAEEKKRSKAPLAIAAALVLAIVGGGAYFFLGQKKSAPPAKTKLASAVPVPVQKPAPVIPEPIVASVPGTSTAPATATAVTTTGAPATATMDEAARKKAFEDAVNKKLHEEMMKLQSEYTRSLQQQQSKNAPVTTAAPPPAVVATATHATSSEELSAAQLDQQRRDSARTTTAPPEDAAPAPQLQTAAPAVTQSVAAPPPVPAIRQGDIIDLADLDVAPRRMREPRIVYPPMAQRQKVESDVMTSVLVSETGDVVDVKILRGDARFGFNEAAIRALKTAKYTPAMKTGVKVKVWLPQMVRFKLQQ